MYPETNNKNSQSVSQPFRVGSHVSPPFHKNGEIIPPFQGGPGGFLSYKYQPLTDLFSTDAIDLKNNKDYIPFGEDNLLPQQIIQLSRQVSVHMAILNSKAFFITGNSLTSENPRLKSWLPVVNNNHEGLRDVLFKVIFDELNTGNAYIEIFTDTRKSFLFLYHIDSSSVRLSANKDEIILHPDWSQYKGKNDKHRSTVPLYPYFKRVSRNLYHSALHIKQYEPRFVNYGLPTWYAGLDSVIIAGLTDVWNKSRLENQFTAQGLLIIPGVNSDEDAEKLDAEFDKYKGFDNEKSHDIIVQYLSDLGIGQSRETAQFIEFKKNDEANWSQLHQWAHNNLLSIHNWYKSLASFFGEKTGFDTQRILNEYEIALKTTIKIKQSGYLALLKRLLADFGFDASDLSFTNEAPVYRINPVKFVWEIRKEDGLPYNPDDPNQQMYYAQLQNTFIASKDAQNNKDKEQNKSKNDTSR